MKHLAIVKHHPCEQLAHLYEHLFVTAVADYLYRHGQWITRSMVLPMIPA